MILISHRGNINGRNAKRENSEDYIKEALNKNYNVEIDVHFYKNNFYLGHDKPQYKTSKKFLTNKKFWIHAKNFESLRELKKFAINYFWHESDQYTLTNKGFIWTYPNKKLCEQSIAVCLKKKHIKRKIFGICSDFVDFYRSKNYEYNSSFSRKK